MGTGTFVMAALVIVTGVFAVWVLRGYLRQRGDRLITCPETLKPEAVRVDAGHAAVTSLMGHTELKLSDCTRWPERQTCGQDCLSQIQAAPHGCLIRSLVADWYKGKTCAICGRPVGDLEWMEHTPALIDLHHLEHRTSTWEEIPPERVFDVMATHAPVCWSCHVTETFRREHADLVVDRPSLAEPAPPQQARH
jgi:hypothetical protein